MSLVLPLPLAAEPASAPDGRALAENAARRLRESFEALGQYTYDVLEREEQLDSKGKVTKTTTRGHEVFYVLGRPVRRLVSENGAPLPAKRQAEEDRRAEKRAREIREKRSGEKTKPGEEERRLAEVLDRYELRAVGHEELEGRRAIVLTVAALPGKRDIEGDKYLRKVAGRVWVDEQEGHLLRAELHTTSSIKVGLGVVASVSEAAATLVFSRLADGTWLPSRIESRGRGRVLLLKGFHVRNTLTYGGFRRFEVETSEQTRPPS
jgi:hypothetical protein